MDVQPRSFLIFLVGGVVAWILVTAAVLVEVIQSPAEHLELALGILLIWVVLVIFAAFSRVTEYRGRRPH